MIFTIGSWPKDLKGIVIFHQKHYIPRMIPELNERSRTVFRYIVDTYLNTGQPVGSRTISTHSGLQLSPASIRNTMADLEECGLLFAPHISAGRMPTDLGLRLYIDGLMQVGGLSAEERTAIEATCRAEGRSFSEVLEQSSQILSGLSSCASLVIAPKTDNPIKQIQFVSLQPKKVLIILVLQNGLVENRVMDLDEAVDESALNAASNYLNDKLSNNNLKDIQKDILNDIRSHKSQLDDLTKKLVEAGLALPVDAEKTGHIIIRGQSKLLEDVKALEDLERARTILGYLEEQQNMLELLKSVEGAQGVQIYIGSENTIFDQSGWSLIISPYKDAAEQIVGAIGVIGPTRLSYDRVIPMVDYTSQLVSRLVGASENKVV